MDLIILGAGTFAKEIVDELNTDIYEFVTSDTLPNFKVPKGECYFLAAIVSPKRKDFIEQFYQQTKIPSRKFIHPTVYLSKKSQVRSGSIICPNVTIASDTIIRNHCIVNRGATIGHDCLIESYSMIGPGVNIAGNVKIGQQTTIGIGANILENTTIGNNCVIGAGSLVTKNIPDNQMWYGVPAKYVREVL